MGCDGTLRGAVTDRERGVFWSNCAFAYARARHGPVVVIEVGANVVSSDRTQNSKCRQEFAAIALKINHTGVPTFAIAVGDRSALRDRRGCRCLLVASSSGSIAGNAAAASTGVGVEVVVEYSGGAYM